MYDWKRIREEGQEEVVASQLGGFVPACAETPAAGWLWIRAILFSFTCPCERFGIYFLNRRRPDLPLFCGIRPSMKSCLGTFTAGRICHRQELLESEVCSSRPGGSKGKEKKKKDYKKKNTLAMFLNNNIDLGRSEKWRKKVVSCAKSEISQDEISRMAAILFFLITCKHVSLLLCSNIRHHFYLRWTGSSHSCTSSPVTRKCKAVILLHFCSVPIAGHLKSHLHVRVRNF